MTILLESIFGDKLNTCFTRAAQLITPILQSEKGVQSQHRHTLGDLFHDMNFLTHGGVLLGLLIHRQSMAINPTERCFFRRATSL